MKKTQIPVFATIGLAYHFIWDEGRDFINLALVPMVVLATLDTVVGTGLSAASEANGGGGALAILGVIFVILVNVAAGVMFAVAWHRRFLVPQESATFYRAFRWRVRHTRFLFVSIAIGLLAILAAALPMLFGALIGPVVIIFLLVAVMLGGLVGARLSMLLPATAVDDLMNFNQAWKLAYRNSWRILSVFILSAIPVGIVASIIGFLLGSLFGGAPGLPGIFVLAFANEFFGFASAALGVTVLSEAYRTLRGAGASSSVTPTPLET